MPQRASAAGAASDARATRSRTIAVSEHTLQEARLLLPGMVGDASHSFKMLRTQVMQRMSQRGWNTLAVLSPGPDEGKTFTAINLAIAIAARPRLHGAAGGPRPALPAPAQALRLPAHGGRRGLPARRGQLADALVAVEGYPDLMLLPARGPVEHSSELISSASARALFREIKERYTNRIVIYDLPPVLATDDALSFVPQVDAALVVVGDDRTKREELMRCFELMRDTPDRGHRAERLAQRAQRRVRLLTMYEKFYGFREKPFALRPDARFLYLAKPPQARAAADGVRAAQRGLVPAHHRRGRRGQDHADPLPARPARQGPGRRPRQQHQPRVRAACCSGCASPSAST